MIQLAFPWALLLLPLPVAVWLLVPVYQQGFIHRQYRRLAIALVAMDYVWFKPQLTFARHPFQLELKPM